MKKFILLINALFLLTLISPPAGAETYDAANDYSCGNVPSGRWSYEAWRAEDGAYLPLIYGHPMIKEVSRYGVNAHYLPGGAQEFYPFFLKLENDFMCSPATWGKRCDALLSWTSASVGKVNIKGSLRLLGNLKGTKAAGKTVKARLAVNEKILWSGVVTAVPERFEAGADVARGDKIRLFVEDGDGEGEKLTGVDLKIETVR